MLLALVISCASLLLVQWCFLLPTSFFVSDGQAHSPNPVMTVYLLDLNCYHSLVVVACFLSANPCSCPLLSSTDSVVLLLASLLYDSLGRLLILYLIMSSVAWRHASMV